MKFVIIASARTGSSHLVNMLSGHPDIFCHGALFGPKIMPVFWPKDERPSAEVIRATKEELLLLRQRDADAFLERIYATGYGRACVGFKIFRYQDDQVLRRLIGDSEIRKVILFRKNVLANYSSALAARDTGKWGAQKAHGNETKPVYFERDRFMAFHDRFIGYYRDLLERLHRKRQRYHLINYEELNDDTYLASLANFLGADPERSTREREQRVVQVKQNSSDILGRSSNMDEVEAFLREYGFEHWKKEGDAAFASLLKEPPADDQNID
ncbi:MAG: hypothetical protein ABSD74_12435 [Rhizomicrobium sp.]|jgi:LPS sulfotransferase NodH